jgi:hypothetical protein
MTGESGGCPATYEAVAEYIFETGDTGCPLCGRDESAHPSEGDGRETPQIVNGQQVGP